MLCAKRFVLLTCAFAPAFFISVTACAEVTVQSGPARVHLIELFTSEGCSSCPPAERWYTTLRQDPRLWKEFAPVSFHVDYWDGLGWKDALASPAYTARQQRYTAAWGGETPYTPEFVADGREWSDPEVSRLAISVTGGNLKATLDDQHRSLAVTFEPAAKGQQWSVFGALLGMGVHSNVKAGENRGRTLQHDFVALDLETSSLAAKDGGYAATLHFPAEKVAGAFVVWVVVTGRIEPVQAAGGSL